MGQGNDYLVARAAARVTQKRREELRHAGRLLAEVTEHTPQEVAGWISKGIMGDWAGALYYDTQAQLDYFAAADRPRRLSGPVVNLTGQESGNCIIQWFRLRRYERALRRDVRTALQE